SLAHTFIAHWYLVMPAEFASWILQFWQTLYLIQSVYWKLPALNTWLWILIREICLSPTTLLFTGQVLTILCYNYLQKYLDQLV
ncbi:hypothetical protein ACJMK2_003352, partial [Sinanodonta woodiana]